MLYAVTYNSGRENKNQMARSVLHAAAATLCVYLLTDCVSSKRVRITYGSGGDVCEGGARKCVKRSATCINDTCLCNTRGDGNGNFACFSPESYHAEIKNDPRLRTFARDSVPLPVTCRYLFSHFRTQFSGYPNCTCEITIHAYNSKHAGKIFVHGYDLALRISPILPQGFSVRQYGTGFQGTYTFRTSESTQFSPDGPWNMSDPPVTLHLPDSVVRTRHDPYNNFGYVEVESCGFSVRFRPFDTTYGKDQTQVPGLALSVDPINNPEWLSLDRVMALVPSGEPSLDAISARDGLEPQHTMLLRLAQQAVAQNQPNASLECAAWAGVVTSCTDRVHRKVAFETCTFVVTRARVVNCVGSLDSGDAVMALFTRCFYSICFQDRTICRQIQAELSSCPNIGDIPEVEAFLQPSTCWMPSR